MSYSYLRFAMEVAYIFSIWVKIMTKISLRNAERKTRTIRNNSTVFGVFRTEGLIQLPVQV